MPYDYTIKAKTYRYVGSDENQKNAQTNNVAPGTTTPPQGGKPQ